MHSGKLGDVIYSLRSVRAVGRSRFYLNDRSVDLAGPLTSVILPIIRVQPYIESADVWRGEKIDCYLDRFREQVPWTENLADRHAKVVGVPTAAPYEAWLFVERSTSVPDLPVALARSKNYRGVRGFWETCHRAVGDRAFFIGTAEEHSDFCEAVGEIRHVPTSNLLEVAELIAGASLFIGNQSCPYAIAEGLKRPVIQETYAAIPNCIFPRYGASFVLDLDQLKVALDYSARRFVQGESSPYQVMGRNLDANINRVRKRIS